MLKRWRGVARTGILALVGLALAAQPAFGDVICKKRRGAMFIRAACRRKELQIRLADFGALGPPGDPGSAGAAGASGTARAYAQVNSYQFHFGMVLAKNFTAASHPDTGVYCLTPAAGIDPTLMPCVVSPEWADSHGSDLLAEWDSTGSFAGGPCSTGDYVVRTFQLPGGTPTPSDEVAFVVIVP
ncbi:MAG: hypothetical protein E6J60_03970 [Deltaproteobacteria bacterium]|nr:MAG: hypothetical protein E6J60_03970 [Deltaproteobacteria bacterium]